MFIYFLYTESRGINHIKVKKNYSESLDVIFKYFVTRQAFTYNVILRRVRLTIAVGKQQVLHILSVLYP